MDDSYDINLEQYNVEKNAFYEKIVDLISRNNGWVNFQKAVFDSMVERDHALLELEELFGIAGEEIKDFTNDAKVLYETFKQLSHDRKFTEGESKDLNDVFLEILLLDESEIRELLKFSEIYTKKQQKSNQIKEIIDFYDEKFDRKPPNIYQQFLKLKKLDERINNIFFKKI